MLKHIVIASLTLFSSCALASPALTAQEVRWLKAASPVLAYAKRVQLPIDVVVQPNAPRGTAPFAMGFVDGRCKLVLSMRGNPDAESVLADVPQEQHRLLMEVMAAHELGHCWRYAQGVWHTLPAGFTDVGDEFAGDASLREDSKQLRETRREEGYADLVALAWTRHQHPDQYASVHAWLELVRGHAPAHRASHDTRAWVRLAKDPAVFAAIENPFEDVRATWSRGLIEDE